MHEDFFCYLLRKLSESNNYQFKKFAILATTDEFFKKRHSLSELLERTTTWNAGNFEFDCARTWTNWASSERRLFAAEEYHGLNPASV